MAEKIKDNPTILREFLAAGLPAFPSNVELNDGVTFNAPGMMLRDWFAGQALMGLGSWTPDGPETFDENGMRHYPGTPAGDAAAVKIKARWAYAQADAMLKAREETRS